MTWNFPLNKEFNSMKHALKNMKHALIFNVPYIMRATYLPLKVAGSFARLSRRLLQIIRPC